MKFSFYLFSIPNSLNTDPDFSSYSTYFADSSVLYEGKNEYEQLINSLIEESTANKEAPMAYLVEPYARRGTAKSRFDLPPCSGGVQGKTKYLAQPGEKANVQWIIQNPVAGGH